MQFALMIYAEPGLAELVTDAEREAAIADYRALEDEPRFVSSTHLQPVETATSVRVVDGQTLASAGPCVDSKEVLGGFCMIEAANLDEALELAGRIPAARLGGVVEVRPVEH